MDLVRAGSISQRHGSAVADPYQDVTDPQYCSKSNRKAEKFTGKLARILAYHYLCLRSIKCPLSIISGEKHFDEEGLRTVVDSWAHIIMGLLTHCISNLHTSRIYLLLLNSSVLDLAVSNMNKFSPSVGMYFPYHNCTRFYNIINTHKYDRLS